MMKAWIIFPVLGSFPFLWFLFEGHFGHLMLLGRCDDRPWVSDKAPVRVSGYLERNEGGCDSCDPDFFKAGYKYVEFEATSRFDLRYWGTAYGIKTPGFYRLEVSPRSSDSTETPQRCDDHLSGLARFRSAGLCPRLTRVEAPKSRYEARLQLETHKRFLGDLHQVRDEIQNRDTGEFLFRYTTHSWTHDGRGFLSLVLNSQNSVFGYGGAVCPHKDTPARATILQPGR